MIQEVIKASQGHNRYCGPGAISAITGLDTRQAAWLIRAVTGRRQITGVGSGQMIKALSRVGVKPIREHKFRGMRPTLNQFWNNTYNGQLLLVGTTGHWVVMYDDYIVDNQQGMISFSESKHKRKKLDVIIYLDKADLDIAEVVELSKPKPKAPPSKDRLARLQVRFPEYRILHNRDERRVYAVAPNGNVFIWSEEQDVVVYYGAGEEAPTFDDALERLEDKMVNGHEPV